MKTICIVGASGLIGTALSAALKNKGYSVLTTSVRSDPGKNPDPSMGSKISESDVVVNLAGAPIFGKRWSNLVKGEIYDSRVEGTKQIVQALKQAKEKYPGRHQTLINASAIGYYGSRGDELLDEESQAGHDFMAFVVKAWEDEAFVAQRALDLRTVVFRFGIVLSEKGGALKKMVPPFKLGLGGPIGCGHQWLSWIHIDDVVGMIVFAIENPIHGAFNATSPTAVKNKEFSHALGHALGRPAILPMPTLALRAVVGEVSAVLTASERINAQKIIEAGFQVKYPHLESALKSILAN